MDTTITQFQNRNVDNAGASLSLPGILKALAKTSNQDQLLDIIDARCGALLRVAGVETNFIDGDAKLGDSPLLQVDLELPGRRQRLVLNCSYQSLSVPAQDALRQTLCVTLGDYLARSAEARSPKESARALTNTAATEPGQAAVVADDLQSAFAHKLRNNLSASMTAINQLREILMPHLDADTSMLMGVLESATEGQRRLIDRFMLLVKPQIVRLARFELGPLLRSLIHRYTTGGNVQVRLEGLEREALVETDRQLYAVVLAELIENAVEASVRKEISVSVTPRESRIEIAIRNDAAPLPAAVSENFFKPFFTTKPGRAGMGLALVRHYTRLLGGAVRHNCEFGAIEFTVALPQDENLC